MRRTSKKPNIYRGTSLSPEICHLIDTVAERSDVSSAAIMREMIYDSIHRNFKQECESFFDFSNTSFIKKYKKGM